ncbi:hypothetical protein SCA6_015511 [Theobroma cacao]
MTSTLYFFSGTKTARGASVPVLGLNLQPTNRMHFRAHSLCLSVCLESSSIVSKSKQIHSISLYLQFASDLLFNF